MTIEIDDSGTGDVLGPGFIGLRRIETNEMVIKVIPIDDFSNNHRRRQKTLDLVIEGLTELKYQPEEIIQVCRGDIFAYVCPHCQKNDIPFEDSVIEGPLQDVLEERFEKYLENVGIDISILHSIKYLLEIDKNQYYTQRISLLTDWTAENLPQREKYIKPSSKKGYQKIIQKARRNELKRDINHLIDRCEYTQALNLIENILDTTFNLKDYYDMKSEVFAKQQQYQKALDVVESASPFIITALNSKRFELFLYIKNYKEALECLREGNFNKEYSYYLIEGQLLVQSDRKQEAINSFEKALEFEPYKSETFLNEIIDFLEKNKLSELGNRFHDHFKKYWST